MKKVPLQVPFSVLVVEIGYVYFMWKRNIRIFWLMMIIGLHLGIGIIMGMWFFAAVMIFLSVLAFGDDVLRDLYKWRRSDFKLR